MSDTPRTDAELVRIDTEDMCEIARGAQASWSSHGVIELTDFARQLERENAAMRKVVEVAKEYQDACLASDIYQVFSMSDALSIALREYEESR